MSEAAIPSVGTRLQLGDGADPEVFTDVGEVISVTPFNGSTESIDCSDLKSGKRVKKPGLLDHGQMQFTVHLVPGATGVYQKLKTAWRNKTPQNFRVVYPDDDDSTEELDTYIMNVAPAVQMGQTIQCSFTAEVNDVVDVVA